MSQPASRIAVRRVAAAYGYRVSAYRKIGSMSKAHAAYRVVAQRRTVLIKPFFRHLLRPGTASRQMAEAARRAQRIMECGYAHMPRWHRTKRGNLWMKLGRRPFYITDWIAGRPLPKDPASYRALGRALAALHSIPVAGHDTQHGAQAGGATEQMIRFYKAQDAAYRRPGAAWTNKRGRMNVWLRQHLPESNALADEAWRGMHTPEAEEVLRAEAAAPVFVHGDVTLPNIVVAGTRLYLIDWDGLAPGSAYDELALALHNTTHYDVALMQAMLAGYESVRPLRGGERRMVGALYRLPRESWFVARPLDRRTGMRTFRALAPAWGLRLQAVAWLDRWSAQTP